MGFLDEVSAFGKGISQKTKDMVDVTANNSRISTLEKQISSAYAALGEKVFADRINDIDGPYQEELNRIRGIMAEINKIQTENKAIEDAQAAAVQAAADRRAAEAEAKAQKQAQIQAAAQVAKDLNYANAVAQGAKICPNCNGIVAPGNLFCTSCGTRVG